MGVDVSARRIAYAITLEDRIIRYGLAHTQTLADRRGAWESIREDTRAAEWSTHRDLYGVWVEDVWLGPNRRGSLEHALSVGQSLAYAHTMFRMSSVDLIQPQSWRKHCGLPTRGKEPAHAYASSLLMDADTKLSQDEADAICISIAAGRITSLAESE